VSDYLWDPDAPADPDVARLERVLAPLRQRPPLPALPPRRRPRRWPIAAAGTVVTCAAAVTVWWWTRDPVRPAQLVDRCATAPDAGGFRFTATSGAPRCAGSTTADGWLPVGEWLETGAGDRARVVVADIGELDLAEDSRLALRATGPAEHRLALDRGRLHARVIAPPRLFVIETPAATAIDLGCEYDLEVAPGGDGLLRVTSGSVELARGPTQTSIVPMGTSARIRRDLGPGTPWAETSSTDLRAAIDRWDLGDRTALEDILARATARDTATLWNLLDQLVGGERGRVVDAIEALVAVPEWVRRDPLISGDAAAISDLREALEGYWYFPESLDGDSEDVWDP
jgi:ferric-dicitrate binding protein FerR (iron transport regulator)